MNMMKIVIEVLIFGALIGTIALSVTSGGNLTGSALVLYSLITIIVVAGFIMYLSKQMGLSGGRK